jgi:acylglycerol lipase
MTPRFFELDKHKIHYHYYTAHYNNVIIVLVHGHGEHLGRYSEWADKFKPFNYTICGLDLPGHGLSNGKKGHIRNYEDYYDILDEFTEIIRNDFPDRPILLYGHSMGGNIVANYLMDRKPDVKAAILSSPWFELAIKPNVFRFWLAKTMYKLFPSLGDRTRLNPNFISRIPDEVEKYKKDPLVHDSITPGLFIPMFFKGLKAKKSGRKNTVPTLVVHGDGDQLISCDASFYYSESNKNISFKKYENGYHELHHDLCRDELHADILDWLSSNVVMR